MLGETQEAFRNEQTRSKMMASSKSVVLVLAALLCLPLFGWLCFSSVAWRMRSADDAEPCQCAGSGIYCKLLLGLLGLLDPNSHGGCKTGFSGG